MPQCLAKFVECVGTRYVLYYISYFMSVEALAQECFIAWLKALGCNFGATTCESCKAFFRRNALKGKVY